MYRLVLYGLGIVAIAGILLGFTGQLSLSGPAMMLSLGVLIITSLVVNHILARVWRVTSNNESTLITALILFCILPPATTLSRFIIIFLAALLAMGSKYLLALHRKHLFNPAAFAAVIVGWLGLMHATWWVGSGSMLVFTLVLGALVVRKTRRFNMVLSFVIVALLVTSLLAAHQGFGIGSALKAAFLTSPLVFLGTIMLTEPATTPPRRVQQIIYGALVGGLYVSQFRLGPIYATPELALLIGNVFAYTVSPKYKLQLRLKEKKQLSTDVYDFSFEPDRPLEFLPGQYLDWTLGHTHIDDRGNRRTFTIASSPTENLIHLGAKFYNPSSSFKRGLLNLKPGSVITAGQLAGDFVLPTDPRQKLVFIAGGIGVTPYRSMIKYLLDNNQRRDITMFYSAKTDKDLVYRELFERARQKLHIKTIYTINEATTASSFIKTGLITSELMKSEVPDYRERLFYISGTHVMVEAMRAMLLEIGVTRNHIKTDFFPGYA